MTLKQLEEMVLAMPHAYLDFPFGEDVNVYKIKVGDDDKMFALIPNNKSPLQISLKCDPELAKTLRERYESVMEGYHLNKKHWNTVLVTGQLSDQEIYDLIVHSYSLVTGKH